jgi:mono/diheme cytochrome c family protein
MRAIVRPLVLLVVATTALAAQKVRSGPEVFATCNKCHLATGEGVNGAIPPLAGSEWVVGRPEVPIAIVLHGVQAHITVKGKAFDSVMPPWGTTMSDQEIANVITYVRTQWGNRASAVTASDVNAVRAAAKTRNKLWTVAELKARYP